MTFKIEKNIPIPEFRGKEDGLPNVIRKMEVGDSIVITSKYGQPAYNAAKAAGAKVMLRSIPGGFRVWRTE